MRIRAAVVEPQGGKLAGKLLGGKELDGAAVRRGGRAATKGGGIGLEAFRVYVLDDFAPALALRES